MEPWKSKASENLAKKQARIKPQDRAYGLELKPDDLDLLGAWRLTKASIYTSPHQTCLW
jgi:hypothetical protein